jgi:hypothetical protein
LGQQLFGAADDVSVCFGERQLRDFVFELIPRLAPLLGGGSVTGEALFVGVNERAPFGVQRGFERITSFVDLQQNRTRRSELGDEVGVLLREGDEVLGAARTHQLIARVGQFAGEFADDDVIFLAVCLFEFNQRSRVGEGQCGALVLTP